MATTTTSTASLTQQLETSDAHRRFVSHRFFPAVANSGISAGHAGIFLGQWWHPLHYFPTFLARCIAVLPDITSKSAITRILAQEVGNGHPDRAHESIYVESMVKAGFDRPAITEATPLPETAELVAGYE